MLGTRYNLYKVCNFFLLNIFNKIFPIFTAQDVCARRRWRALKKVKRISKNEKISHIFAREEIKENMRRDGDRFKVKLDDDWVTLSLGLAGVIV